MHIIAKVIRISRAIATDLQLYKLYKITGVSFLGDTL